jgi:hypothetical protein
MTMSQASSPSSTTSKQKNKNEKEANQKKVVVHLLATNALVIFWRNVFCNTTLATSSATPLLQHCFNTHVQHCFL